MFTLFIVRYCIMYELYKFSYHETEYNDDTEKKTLVIESNGRRFATQKRTFRGKTIAEKMKQYPDEILPAPPSISSCTISSWS